MATGYLSFPFVFHSPSIHAMLLVNVTKENYRHIGGEEIIKYILDMGLDQTPTSYMSETVTLCKCLTA